MKIKDIYVITLAQVKECRESVKGSYGQVSYTPLAHKYLAKKKTIKNGTPSTYNEFKLIFSATKVDERLNIKHQENVSVVAYEPLGLYVYKKHLSKKKLLIESKKLNSNEMGGDKNEN